MKQENKNGGIKRGEHIRLQPAAAADDVGLPGGQAALDEKGGVQVVGRGTRGGGAIHMTHGPLPQPMAPTLPTGLEGGGG